MYALPPTWVVPLPTFRLIMPPLPDVAAPVPTVIRPELPELVVPELNASAPLTPEWPALRLFTVTEPLLVETP